MTSTPPIGCEQLFSLVRMIGKRDHHPIWDIVQHGVPPMDEACGPSGSIVGRAIKTVIPWEKVHANIAASERAKQKRLEAKKRKKESAIEVVQAEEKKQKVE